MPVIRTGETLRVWIDPSQQSGGCRLASVDNQAISGEVTIGSIAAIASVVEIVLNATAAEAGDESTLTCEIHPQADQTIKATLNIEVID